MWTLRDALTGVRVLEDALGSGAPYAGRLLADLGADVVKVEPTGGDPLRRRTAGHDGFSGTFDYVNAGKRSIAFDRDHATGRGLLDRLRQWADVLLVDEPGAADLNEAAQRGLRPEALIVAVTPFGLAGPRREGRAGPRSLFHEGGMIVDVRSDTRPHAPASPTGQFAHFDGGALAAVGVVALLVSRRLGSAEQPADPTWLDVSVQDAVVHSCRQDLMLYPGEGLAISPRHGSVIGPYGAVVIPCADGTVMTHVGRAEWNRFAQLNQWPEWIDALFLDPGKLTDDTETATRLLHEWARSRTRADVSRTTTEAGFTITPISTPLEVLDDDQLMHRNFFTPLESGSRRYLAAQALPFLFTAPDIGADRGRPVVPPSPAIGEHTAAICAQHGIDAQAAAVLYQHDVIGAAR